MAEAETYYERLRVYQLAEELGDLVWQIVEAWQGFTKSTIGGQLVRSADSIGANLAEGSGCQSIRQKRHFVTIARGSLFETKHWLRLSYRRNLLTSDQIDQLKTLLDSLLPQLNAYHSYLGSRSDSDLNESPAAYDVGPSDHSLPDDLHFPPLT